MSNPAPQGMCIPYEVRTMPDKGRGVFATSFTPAGTTVWRHVAGRFTVFDESSLQALLTHLTDPQVEYVLTHIHSMQEFPEHMIWAFDEGELLNHSEQPNVSTHTTPGYEKVRAGTSCETVRSEILDDHFTLIATRDIEKGEELTMNYNTEPDDPEYFDALCEHYGVKWDWLST